MKRLSFFAFMICLAVCFLQAKERVIKLPPFTAWNSTTIEIEKITLTDTETILDVHAFYRPNYWIKVPQSTFLVTNQGDKYQIKGTDGIPMDEEFYMPESGEAKFRLFFPPLPDSVTEIDFIEEVEGGFKIWGIRLTDEGLPGVQLPSEYSRHITTKTTGLPDPVYQKGKAVIKGQVGSFRPEIMEKLELLIGSPVGFQEQEIYINNDGTFEKEVDVISLTPCAFFLRSGPEAFFIAPGETTHVFINLSEMHRNQSKLRCEEPPTGKTIYFGGYMADVAEEYNEHKILWKYEDILEDIQDRDLTGIKEYFLAKHQGRLAHISSLDISEATKEILSRESEAQAVMDIQRAKSYLTQAMVQSQKITREEANDYYTNLEYPDNYFDDFKHLAGINTPKAIYNMNYSLLLGSSDFPEQFSKAIGTNKGNFFESSEAASIFSNIDDFQPLTEEDRAKLSSLSSPLFLDMAEEKNNELLKRIEANKKKTGFTVNEAGEVANEDLFASMISKYRGKTILVDFWATWCGPCRMANSEMAPMKEELKEKDIVYLYIAGDNSPEKTWENMIPDIPGEHFRVTKEQWKYLGDAFKIDGVPTYLIVNGEGDIKYKQVGYPGVNKIREELLKALAN